ncbi:acetyltransferase [Streptomyces sp. WM6373]|uniref:GNAT family N-acetyltransferase n=1 Tax=Streptomyces TaxID=1883 RepID=UPI0006AF6184|nr:MULTISPECIES: GNAT family N-acetyltransferase [unclassified Streptomyces]KOU40283.1 acetyltransferase [Streptomyces sp. WM6373]KOU70714.1 acetyltransferase [Streptomyces sp. IGB124]KOU73353.1 acetyltransferase [Streptomyces sp. XY66]KOV47600.1 acetyltransferase [Streptomyces sp. H021]
MPQSPSTPIEFQDEREAGRLLAVEDGKAVGYIAYFVLARPPHALVAVHTIVEPGHEGRGIAGGLVRTFYGLAEAEGVPVVPLCPYAASWAAKHPDEAPDAPADVVAAAKAQLAAGSDLP